MKRVKESEYKKSKNILYCDFVQLANRPGCYYCRRVGCNQPPVCTPAPPIHRECGAEYPEGEPPSFIEKLSNFSKAYAKWVDAGRPLRTKEEIDRIFNICIQCPHYDKCSSSCKLCGCKLNRRKKYLNKIAWATEKCPDNPPRWA